MQATLVREHSPRAPERSLPLGLWPPEPMHRALLAPPGWRRGPRRKVQQAHLLHQVRQQCELGLLGTEDFAHQHKTQ
jgi:hypothetical protein